MIKISIGIGEKGPLSVEARGHSGYAKREKMSFALQCRLNACPPFRAKEVVEAKDVVFDIQDDVPLFFLSWNKGTLEDPKAKAVIETVLGSLRSIAHSYQVCANCGGEYKLIRFDIQLFAHKKGREQPKRQRQH